MFRTRFLKGNIMIRDLFSYLVVAIIAALVAYLLWLVPWGTIGLGVLWLGKWALIIAAVVFLVLVAVFLGVKRVPLKKLLLLTYADDLVCGIMNFSGRSFDANGKVVSRPGEFKYYYGKCPWIFIWRRWVFYVKWLVSPVPYDQHNDADGFGSGIYVDLSDHFVTVHVEDAETKDIQDPADPTKIIPGPAVTFDAQCPGLVDDPRLFVIGSPPDVFQKGVIDEFTAIMRRWARLKTEAEVLNAQVGGEVGADLVDPDPAKVNAGAAFGVMRDRWGFNLSSESITIKSVSFDKSYQEARQQVREESMRAQGTFARVFDPITKAKAQGIDDKAAVRLMELDMGAQVMDVNIHSGDQSISPDTLVIGGGGVGIMAGGQGGGKKKGRGGQGNTKGNADSDQGDKKYDTPEAADRYFKRNGKYPDWDPLKRNPHE